MASDKVETAPDASKSYNDKFMTEPIVTEPHPDSHNGMHDVEKHGANRESLPLPDLKRKLKSRHLQMIAIGSLYFLSSAAVATLKAHMRLLLKVAQSELVSSLVVELPSQTPGLQVLSSHTSLSDRLSTQS